MLSRFGTLAAFASAVAIGLMSLIVAPAANAQDAFNQLQLTDKHIQGFIAAQADITQFIEKNPAQEGTAPTDKQQAELDAIAKKHSFKDYTEYDDVAYNISVILSGIDPDTGKYTDPIELIKKEIAEINADSQINPAEKKQMLEELNDALKNTPPVKFPSNITLVSKHREALEKALGQQ
jgi:hypothetical protein